MNYQQQPWWLRALGFSGALATAIIGVLTLTVSDRWGPLLVIAVVAFGLWLCWQLWQRRLR